MKVFLYPICLLFLFSCQNTKKADIAYLLGQWSKKEVLFPEHPVFTVYTSDTIDYQIPASPYKVLFYADSIGCMSCKMQLDKWKTFIEEVDSITHQQVPFLFFLDTRQLRDIKHILRRDKFTYPVCIDITGELNRLNQLPEDPTFHTFLLDHENRVLLIGNPINNNAMRELYMKEFNSLSEF